MCFAAAFSGYVQSSLLTRLRKCEETCCGRHAQNFRRLISSATGGATASLGTAWELMGAHALARNPKQ